MLVREPSWLKLLFRVRGSSLRRIWSRLLMIILFSVAVTYAYRMKWLTFTLTLVPFTLIGLPLGIFLGFRSNHGYSRYWEGRKLWGAIVNDCRTLCRQALLFLDPPNPSVSSQETHKESLDSARTRSFLEILIAYPYLLRSHLIGQIMPEEPSLPLAPSEQERFKESQNRPLFALFQLGKKLREISKEGTLHPYSVGLLEQSLTALTNAQGGCERIRNTPFPLSYSILTHRTVVLYCYFLPFGLVTTLQGLTPVVCFLIAYVLLALDALADAHENPFTTKPDALPMLAISRTIEINIRQESSDTDIPRPIQSEHGILP